MKAVERFLLAAAARGITPDVHEFSEGTRTASAAARAVGCDLAQIVKSLVFMASGEPILALTSGANRADPKKLAEVAGATSARLASPEEVRKATGYAIGGTPPFGHHTRLRVFIDPDLLSFDEVWAAAGTPRTVWAISPEKLIAASDAETASFTVSVGSEGV